MRRREFIGGLAAAGAWHSAARAQRVAIPSIGFVSGRSPTDSVANVAAFRKGLQETGFAEGGNVEVQYRWAEGRYDQNAELIAGLIRRPVVVLTVFNIGSALAAKQATATIPIVFGASGDPVKLGLVSSFNRPGGNVTGVSFLNTVLVAKQFEVLHDVIPPPISLAMLLNPTYVNANDVWAEAHQAATSRQRILVPVEAASDSEIEAAFASARQQRIGGLLVAADPFFDSRIDRIAELAARYGIPTIHPSRSFAHAGGLMSYGTDITEAFRMVGSYAGRILKGEKPAELPVQQVTKVELIINMKVANALGITMPLPLLGRADEVLE
jgi:putative tryptophan/tyrosine transport system substrate-binding protein